MNSTKKFLVEITISKTYTVNIEKAKPEGMSDEEFVEILDLEAYRKYGNNEYMEYVATYGETVVWEKNLDEGTVKIATRSDNQKVVMYRQIYNDDNLHNMIIDKYEMLSESFFGSLTCEQKESVIQVVARQGIDRLLAAYAPTTFAPRVCLAFEHILISIERDGYAHS